MQAQPSGGEDSGCGKFIPHLRPSLPVNYPSNATKLIAYIAAVGAISCAAINLPGPLKMNTSTTPNHRLIGILGRIAPTLDEAAHSIAGVLSYFTRVVDAGVFCLGEDRPRVAAWREDHGHGSRSYVLQLGYMEFGIDCRAPKGHRRGPSAAR